MFIIVVLTLVRVSKLNLHILFNDIIFIYNSMLLLKYSLQIIYIE